MWINFTSIETRIIVLPDAENPTIVSFIRLDKTSGCDGRTDERTDGRREFLRLLQMSALRECGRAVKNGVISRR